jgi:hypothetical protein
VDYLSDAPLQGRILIFNKYSTWLAKGKLSAVDLLIEIACFEKRKKIFCIKSC